MEAERRLSKNLQRRKGLSLTIQHLRKPTEDDLVPNKNRYHKIDGIDDFMWTVLDEYAREYGEFFQQKIKEFDSGVLEIKRHNQQQITGLIQAG